MARELGKTLTLRMTADSATHNLKAGQIIECYKPVGIGLIANGLAIKVNINTIYEPEDEEDQHDPDDRGSQGSSPDNDGDG